jgi:hypothetical protein
MAKQGCESGEDDVSGWLPAWFMRQAPTPGSSQKIGRTLAGQDMALIVKSALVDKRVVCCSHIRIYVVFTLVFEQAGDRHKPDEKGFRIFREGHGG